MGARDKPAGQDGQCHQRTGRGQQPPRDRRGLAACRLRIQHAQSSPQDGGIQGEREHEMHHQPVRRHRGAVGREAGGHHEPAHAALSAAEQEQPNQPAAHPAQRLSCGKDPARPEPEQRHQERQADQPTPEPVQIFQPEDPLEALDTEPLVQQGILRDLLVQLEQPLPLRIRDRRQCATEGGPFHDGQSRSGQPCGATQQDHAQDHHADAEQPNGHGPASRSRDAADIKLDGLWRRLRQSAENYWHDDPYNRSRAGKNSLRARAARQIH